MNTKTSYQKLKNSLTKWYIRDIEMGKRDKMNLMKHIRNLLFFTNLLGL